jgi:dipeptidyl aminopeptidase/acylaminoacyl peptidase
MTVTTLRHLTRLACVLALALVFWPAAPAATQRTDAAGPAVTPRTAPDGKKVLTLADYGPWKRITSTAISDDGKWATYTYSPNDGDETLFVKQLDGDTLYTIPIGSAAGGGGRGGGRGGGGGGGAAVQFSDDSRWIGYFVNPPARAAGRGRGAAGARGGGRGAAPPRGGATEPGATPPTGANASADAVRRFELLDLTSGMKFSVPNAGGFQFSKGSAWVAIKVNGAAGDTSHRGSDLLLRRLATGVTQNIGNVNQYDFDDAGKLLAYTVDATSHMGNGVYVTNLATGETRALDGTAKDYDGLAWGDSSTRLAALRGEKPEGKTEKENVLLAWTDAGAPQPAGIEWDPAKDTTFPKGFVLSEYSAPRWSKDGSRLFVGIKAQEEARAETTEPQANLDIYHWKDVELQSEQIIRLAQERRATFTSVLTLASKKFVQLADTSMKTVTPTADDRWAIGRDPTAYEHDFSEGQPARADYYKIDTATGARTLITKHLLRAMGSSSDSKWFLYLENKRVMAYSLETGRAAPVDAGGANFINTDNDQAAEKPIWGVAGWAKDGKSVLLYDKYDVWSQPLDGGRGTDLTAGAGAAGQMQLRLARLTGGGRGGGRGGAGLGGGGGADEGVDLSQPQTLTAYGDWTKKSGYWRLPAGGGKPTPLIWGDKSIGQAQKAKDADRVMFTQQTFEEFPDYWVSDSSFASPRKITDANPQISEYAWGKRILVDYTNSKGRKLQATLALPADYQPGKQYPMLVYIYEILSNTHHQFSMPVYDDRPHMSAYASDGYLVLEPDIVYDVGRPGSSALDCVTAAVKKVIELGYADPKHIGLQGHSWGGYESSFIVTQTNMFAAVVTGAPLTDLISMYGELYKQTGSWNGGILETSQGRMGANVTPWNAKDLYESESPVFNVTKIQTPFMILQGTSDGAVDWDQGLEFYNAARRTGKQVIFLSYPDEPHHLAKPENQKDFQVRMKQFFDHYLKGTPQPEWMANGLPQVKKGEPIR